jgi:hypothetical protein
MRLGRRVEWLLIETVAAYVFLVAFLDLHVCPSVARNWPMICEQNRFHWELNAFFSLSQCSVAHLMFCREKLLVSFSSELSAHLLHISRFIRRTARFIFI